MRTLFSAFLATLLLALAAPAQANSMRAGDITVHFNAVPTTTLTAEVARSYGVTRSANRALVNIAVRQGEPGADRALAATVRLVAINQAGQRSDLRAREVREGEAIYYLAEARIGGHETLTFELEVQPSAEGAGPMRTTFEQEFFPE